MREDVLRAVTTQFPRSFCVMHLGRLVLSRKMNKRSVFHVRTQRQRHPLRPRRRSRTHKVTVTAMLSAVAFVLMFIEFPIPALIPAFVKLDISDLPELLAAFSLGPVYGVVVAFLKKPALRRAARHLVRLRRRAVQLPHGVGVRLLRRLCLPAQQVPPGRAARRGHRHAAHGGALRSAELLRGLSRLRGLLSTCRSRPSSGCIRRSVPRSTVCSECLLVFNMPFTFFKRACSTWRCAF